MSQRLLATASTHSDSLLSLVDKACSYALDTVLSAGSGPVARVAELGVTSFLNKLRHGHLRIVTASHVYSYPLAGTGLSNEHPKLCVELKVVHDSFWTRMLTMSDLGFAEAYMYGEVVCDDLQSLFKIFMVNREELSGFESSRLAKLFTAVPHYITNSRFANTLSTSRSNISAHYDISNRMFEGFLSQDMMYSCAIFEELDADLRRAPIKPTPVIDKLAGLKNASESSECSSTTDEAEHDDLHQAQLRKIRHILGKAKIQDGHRVLEIGSGWGEMAIHAAKTARCTVDTLTLSSEQKVLAEKRIAAAGLSDRIRVHLMDYRAMPAEWEHTFDRVISIEMVEAVGIEFLPVYWGCIDWALKLRGGVGVIQGITMPETRFDNYVGEVDFIRKWIFPGGICPTVSGLISTMAKGSNNRLIVDSVENIGPHYARTLREWARRFNECFDDVIAPTLRDEHPTVMNGQSGDEELEIFRRKWMCKLFLLLRSGFLDAHARRPHHRIHAGGGRRLRLQCVCMRTDASRPATRPNYWLNLFCHLHVQFVRCAEPAAVRLVSVVDYGVYQVLPLYTLSFLFVLTEFTLLCTILWCFLLWDLGIALRDTVAAVAVCSATGTARVGHAARSLHTETMSFGTELPDQVDLISSISDNHLKLLADVKDLVKERAALEREYALKLQALARRGQEKRARLMNALLVGDTPTRAWGDDAVKKSTFDRAYDHLLTSFEQQAMDHIDLSEALGSQVVDSFRALERTTQERQSKQAAFYSKLLAERDKHYNEQAKTKQKYYEECKEFEIYRQKQGRAQGDRHAERAAKQYEHQKVEMVNHKNTYIIATAVANTVKQQFYESDLPRLEDQYQLLQARVINQLAAIVDRAESIHLTHLDALRGRHASVQETLKTVDTAADQALFVEFNRRPFQIPPPWEFEACPDFYDTGDITSTGESKVFLQNKLSRSRGKLAEVRPVIDGKRNEIVKFTDLTAELDANPSLGKADEVVDNLVDAQHSLTFLEMLEHAFATEDDILTGVLGDDEGEQQPHNFKSASFSLPSPCAYCKTSIWGLSKQGKTCKDCGLSVHMKCELKVPANCPGGHGRAPTSRLVSHTHTDSRTDSRISTPQPTTASAFAIPPVQDEMRRNAMILFDYTASSPYELSVTEGSVVQILEDDDGSGWVKVQDSDGDKGLVPASYVEIGDGSAPAASTIRGAPPAPTRQPTYVRGLYDYTAQGEDEISIQAGQLIQLTDGVRGGQNYGDGWWEGLDAHGRRGIFPSNYVELA